MVNYLNVSGYLSYKTNYYEFFTKFLDVNNKYEFVNILCLISGV